MRGIYKRHLASGDTAIKNSGNERGNMEFLKEILGEELFAQFAEKINAHNGNEANREKQVKLANLGSGEYVGRGKYDALNEMLNGKQTELDTANGLIAELKKGTKGNEELQGKIAAYDAQVQQLQAQLQETKVKSALKVALLSEKAIDIDYLTFKVNEKLKADGKTLELDENENIKGWDDLKNGLKTQFPNQFESAKNNGFKVEANPLPTTDNNRASVTKEQFDRMGYQGRLKLKQEQPEVYAQMTGRDN